MPPGYLGLTLNKSEQVKKLFEGISKIGYGYIKATFKSYFTQSLIKNFYSIILKQNLPKHI